ncbi:hypothetical protein LguiA_021946 [Lonicera macranthoides]
MYQSAKLMAKSNVSYNYEFASHGRKIIKRNIPPPKGVVVVYNIHLREVSKDKLRNANGQISRAVSKKSHIGLLRLA